MSDTDLQLLARYSRDQAEDAFAEIVRRHVDLVYSAALRQVRSPQLAEEVGQSAFTDLARNADTLKPGTVLTAWLYQVTRRTAIDVVRRETRRQLRELIATEMNAMNAPETGWTHIEPLLDEAMSALDEPDRAAVLLRYFENKSLREVGQQLGVTDDAAQKRVTRAVERLREFFARRGVSVGAGGLVGGLSAHAVQAAPAGLGVTLSTAALLATAGLSAPAGASATAGVFAWAMQAARTKLGAGLAAVAVAGMATCFTLRTRHPADGSDATAAHPVVGSNPDQKQLPAGSAAGGANGVEKPHDPDPLALLMGVAKARQRIASGTVEYQHTVEQMFQPGRPMTNHLRLLARFEGAKLRFEQFDREYSYAYSADEAKQQEITKQADSMGREAAVQAGLLKPFESHHVAAYDGVAVMDYWESDGKAEHMTIDAPGRSASFLGNPRCLGLSSSTYVETTVEGCLGYADAKSFELAGEESVEGIPAWHVRVQSRSWGTLDFWIEVAHPERVLKRANGSDVVLSKYEGDASRDPLPVEVKIMTFRNGAPFMGEQFIRSNASYNVPMEPSSFTLSGLGIAKGTPVTDNRISRSIGYWTGTGLSEDLSPADATKAEGAPKLDEQVALLNYNPATPEAFDAAKWILLNTPDGAEVEKAAQVIRLWHARDTNLLGLCQSLERLRHRCSKELLAALLKENPSVDVRGNACFTLATLLKDEANYGQNKPATAQAEKQFERVIAEFGRVEQRGLPLAGLAQPELSELRRLTLGKPAPEIEGVDLEGQPMKLSDYRGKVVMLVFWASSASGASDHKKLAEYMAGKPFALLGVCIDNDLTKGKAEAEKSQITWPSFWDGRDGPISKNWNVQSWPNVWLLDRQGVIRYRDLRGRELRDAVEKLLGE